MFKKLKLKFSSRQEKQHTAQINSFFHMIELTYKRYVAEGTDISLPENDFVMVVRIGDPGVGLEELTPDCYGDEDEASYVFGLCNMLGLINLDQSPEFFDKTSPKNEGWAQLCSWAATLGLVPQWDCTLEELSSRFDEHTYTLKFAPMQNRN